MTQNQPKTHGRKSTTFISTGSDSKAGEAQKTPLVNGSTETSTSLLRATKWARVAQRTPILGFSVSRTAAEAPNHPATAHLIFRVTGSEALLTGPQDELVRHLGPTLHLSNTRVAEESKVHKSIA